MAVNGIEIVVGQVWRTRGGAELTIRRHDSSDDEQPWLASADDESYWLAPNGQLFLSRTDCIDIVELIKDEHGFTIWRGGAQPDETRGKAVFVKLRDGTETSAPVDAVWMRWSHTDTVSDIVAYKVATAAPPVADTYEQLVPSAATPLEVQVGGDHYKSMAIQPIEYIHANNTPFAEGSVIKYVSRWRAKNGIKDLEKARHFIDLLISLETKADAAKGGAQ